MSFNGYLRKNFDKTLSKYSSLINYLKLMGVEDKNKKYLKRKIQINGKLRTKTTFWIEFEIQPTELSRVYKLLIVYIEGYSPYIYVLNPNLNELNEGDEKIPHLYDQKRFQLCLYYPNYNEYKSDEDIATQLIPWIKMWLYYFEEWLYSKEWKGDGIHPGDEKDLLAKSEKELSTPKSKKLKKKKDDKDYIKLFADSIYHKCLQQILKDIENERL